jgi:glycosyltransferase involved in cell wall biosynthesis
MSMNTPLVVMADSDKTSEYVVDCGEGLVVPPEPGAIREAVQELLHKEVNTRDYVLGKWSETHYADALEAGLKKITC